MGAVLHTGSVNDVINLEKLIEARGDRSRSSVAKALGITRQQIWNYETGSSEPPVSVLCALAELYGVQISEFVQQKNFSMALN